MGTAINIAINDLRVFLSDRGNWVSLFFTPIVLALVLGAALGGTGGSDRLRIDVIDQDGSDLSQQFMAEVRAINETLALCPADNDEDDFCRLENAEALSVEDARQRVEDGITAALLVIPQGYGEAVQAFEPIELDYFSREDFTSGNAVLQSVQAATQRINGAVIASRVGTALGDAVNALEDVNRDDFSQAVYETANEVWAQDNATVRYVASREGEEAETSATTAPNGFSQSVPGMGAMFTLLTVLTGMSLLIRERKQWTLQRLGTMPVSRAQLLGGKILARFSTGLITFAILVAVGLVVGVDFGDNPLAIAIIVIAYTLCVTALTFAIAPLVRTEQQAGSIANLLGLTLSALGGAWWPLEIVPDVMRFIGHLSPVAWAMDGFNEVLFYGSDWPDILLPVGVLLAASAVLFFIGTRTFDYD